VNNVVDSARAIRAAIIDAERKVVQRPAVSGAGGGSGLVVYKAIADESGGEIRVKRVDSDGEVYGDEVTVAVLP